MLEQPHPILTESKVPFQKSENNEENTTWEERKIGGFDHSESTTNYRYRISNKLEEKNTFDECPAYDKNVIRYDHTTCRKEKK